MRIVFQTVLLVLLLCPNAGLAAEPARPEFPVPETVSPQIQVLMTSEPPSFLRVSPKNAAEWKTFAKQFEEAVLPALAPLKEAMGVTVTPGSMAGVTVFTITPKTLSGKKADRVLLHFHGGGYVEGQGEAGTIEAVLMAGMGGYRIISVDYRMPPDFPYPAAMDDAVAVYKELLKTVPAEKIGVFGTSTGGGMTLALMLRAKAENLPLPGAIAPGMPWSDLSKTGDSYFTNDHVDNVLVTYDGWLEGAAKLYAAGRDLKDPMLSPLYGDVSGFPPTLLTSGTRDLFLSNTVRMHLKLRESGVPADLIVFEGMSHAQYYLAPDGSGNALPLQRAGTVFQRPFALESPSRQTNLPRLRKRDREQNPIL